MKLPKISLTSAAIAAAGAPIGFAAQLAKNQLGQIGANINPLNRMQTFNAQFAPLGGQFSRIYNALNPRPDPFAGVGGGGGNVDLTPVVQELRVIGGQMKNLLGFQPQIIQLEKTQDAKLTAIGTNIAGLLKFEQSTLLESNRKIGEGVDKLQFKTDRVGTLTEKKVIVHLEEIRDALLSDFRPAEGETLYAKRGFKNEQRHEDTPKEEVSLLRNIRDNIAGLFGMAKEGRDKAGAYADVSSSKDEAYDAQFEPVKDKPALEKPKEDGWLGKIAGFFMNFGKNIMAMGGSIVSAIAGIGATIIGGIAAVFGGKKVAELAGDLAGKSKGGKIGEAVGKKAGGVKAPKIKAGGLGKAAMGLIKSPLGKVVGAGGLVGAGFGAVGAYDAYKKGDYLSAGLYGAGAVASGVGGALMLTGVGAPVGAALMAGGAGLGLAGAATEATGAQEKLFGKKIEPPAPKPKPKAVRSSLPIAKKPPVKAVDRNQTMPKTKAVADITTANAVADAGKKQVNIDNRQTITNNNVSQNGKSQDTIGVLANSLSQVTQERYRYLV